MFSQLNSCIPWVFSAWEWRVRYRLARRPFVSRTSYSSEQHTHNDRKFTTLSIRKHNNNNPSKHNRSSDNTVYHLWIIIWVETPDAACWYDFVVTATQRSVHASVVRYRQYLAKYRDTKRDDTGIAEVTVYRGAARYHEMTIPCSLNHCVSLYYWQRLHTAMRKSGHSLLTVKPFFANS